MWCGDWADNSRPLFTLIGAAAFIALVAVPLVLIARTRGVRGPLAVTWAAASVVAAFTWMLAGGLWWLSLSVVAGFGLGFVVSCVEAGRSRATFAVVGAFGGAGWVAALAALTVAFSAATGACLH